MATRDRQGTFWMIDGIKVKIKKPFLVQYVPRVMSDSLERSRKNETPEVVHLGGGILLTDKSYEDMADRGVDYGMIRLSEVGRSSLFLFGDNQEGLHNFSKYPQHDNGRLQIKQSIFLNEFSAFSYEN